MTIGQPFVIDSEQVQNRGLKIMNVNRIRDDVESEIVGGSVEMP